MERQLPKIRCIGCKRWCSISPDTQFCEACEKPLDIINFQEMLDMDAAVNMELDRITGHASLIRNIPLVLAATSFLVLAITPLTKILAVIAILASAWAWRYQSRARRLLYTRFSVLWKNPRNFTPSIPQPE